LKDKVLNDGIGNAEIDDTVHGIVQSVNGQLTTNEAMRPGEPNRGASPTRVPTGRSISHWPAIVFVSWQKMATQR
jgi:hypothetical protein